jgi:hypothetical protein
MAARRERERRRPSERRYSFTSEPSLEPDEEALVEQDEQTGESSDGATRPTRAAAATAVATAPRGTARPAPRPFSAYRDEYAYVSSDLRRVAAVIGGLLVALVVLYFVLPLLVH